MHWGSRVDGDNEERVADNEVKVRKSMARFPKISTDPFLWQAPLALNSHQKIHTPYRVLHTPYTEYTVHDVSTFQPMLRTFAYCSLRPQESNSVTLYHVGTSCKNAKPHDQPLLFATGDLATVGLESVALEDDNYQ